MSSDQNSVNTWRFISSPPSDGAGNMSIDEALFLSVLDDPSRAAVRTYPWIEACLTIGYFQPFIPTAAHLLPITRRMTGGLTVQHGNDLSYAVIAGIDRLPSLYDQAETYRIIHQGVHEALKQNGIASVFHAASPAAGIPHRNILCINSFYPGDLIVEGNKIVGSCQRRRGNVILVQGSIHIKDTVIPYERLSAALAESWQSVFKARFNPGELTGEEMRQAETLRKKYTSSVWNELR